jgi:hypothetical protein
MKLINEKKIFLLKVLLWNLSDTLCFGGKDENSINMGKWTYFHEDGNVNSLDLLLLSHEYHTPHS